MGAAVRFKTTQVPRQQGETARIKVLRGPDYGAVYVMSQNRATIGRGEDNDIVISDLKASRNHAEIALTQQGWSIRDLASANGILHNGKAVRGAALASKDVVTIGETQMEFVGSEQATLMLVAPVRSVEQVQAEQAAFEAQKDRIRALAHVGAGAVKAGNPFTLGIPGARGGAIGQQNGSKRLLLYGGVALFVAFMMFGGEEPPKKAPAKKEPTEQRNLQMYLPTEEAPQITRSSDLFFRNGFREYRQGNYLRAKQQFETVLQMSPGHPLATLYMKNCETRIKDEVKAHLDSGRRSFDSGKLKDAKAHFEAIVRLLHREQTNPAFIEAREQLDNVLKAMNAEVPS